MTEQPPKPTAARTATPPPNPTEPDQTVQSTPIRRKLTAHTAFAIDAPAMQKAQAKLVQETQGHYIGPMPPHLFVDTFMPWNEKTPKKFRNMEPSAERIATLQSMVGLPENRRYAKIIGALSGWPHDCVGRKKAYIKCPLDLKDSHSYRDVACGSLGVDITGYHPTRPRIPRKTAQVMDFGNAEIWWEDKPTEGSDAFVDGNLAYDGAEYAAFFSDAQAAPEGEDEGDEEEEEDEEEDLDIASDGDEARETRVIDELDLQSEADKAADAVPTPEADYPFENRTEKGRKTRGQLASYGGATMILQFRNHLFSILTCGRYARFMRWDRSAAIVSARFDFVEHSNILFDFFKRFSQLTDEQRGIDITARPATKKQAKQTRNVMKAYASDYWMGRALTNYRDEVDIATESFLQVHFEFDDETYITPAPVCDPSGFSPFGRCSRARMVHAITAEGKDPKKALRFSKDYWREDSKYTYPESVIYDKLKENAVQYVATMAAGGDTNVKTVGHTMASQDWVAKGSKPLRIRQLFQHIIILETIGRSLTTFRTARQMVTCIADAMEGHSQALQRCSILHRDISVGNIMMTLTRQERRGILIDWDHCVVLNLINSQPRITRVLRTGTWQFLSAHLSRNPSAEHTAVDDQESALHVLLWLTLRYLHHDLPGVELRGYLKDVFDDYWQIDDGAEYGTFAKEAAITRGGLPKRMTLVRQPVQKLITSLCQSFATRYDGRPTVPDRVPKDEEDEFAIMEAQAQVRLWDLRAAKLSRSDWLYTTMRQFAEELPELSQTDGEGSMRDWVDNGRRADSTEKKRKRGKTEDGWEEGRLLKQSKAFDGMTVSSFSSALDARTESKPE